MPLSENNIVSVNKFFENDVLANLFVTLFNYQESITMKRTEAPLQLIQRIVSEDAWREDKKGYFPMRLLGCRIKGRSHMVWHVFPSGHGYLMRLQGLKQYVLFQQEDIEVWKVLLRANSSMLLEPRKTTPQNQNSVEISQLCDGTETTQKTCDISAYKIARNCRLTLPQLATFTGETEGKIRRIVRNPKEHVAKDTKIMMCLLGISSAVLGNKTGDKK